MYGSSYNRGGYGGAQSARAQAQVVSYGGAQQAQPVGRGKGLLATSPLLQPGGYLHRHNIMAQHLQPVAAVEDSQKTELPAGYVGSLLPGWGESSQSMSESPHVTCSQSMPMSQESVSAKPPVFASKYAARPLPTIRKPQVPVVQPFQQQVALRAPSPVFENLKNFKTAASRSPGPQSTTPAWAADAKQGPVIGSMRAHAATINEENIGRIVTEIIDSRQQSYEDIHRASISEIHDILSASQKLSQTPSDPAMLEQMRSLNHRLGIIEAHLAVLANNQRAPSPSSRSDTSEVSPSLEFPSAPSGPGKGAPAGGGFKRVRAGEGGDVEGGSAELSDASLHRAEVEDSLDIFSDAFASKIDEKASKRMAKIVGMAKRKTTRRIGR